jgi:hypothetical protein
MSKVTGNPWGRLVVKCVCLQVVDGYSTLRFVCHYLITVNAAVNPIIYGLTNENFRRAFRTTILARRLFGTAAAVTIPRAPLSPIRTLEPRNLYHKADYTKQWFCQPK